MELFKNPIPRLRPDDIEVKVKQVSEKGAVALLYKTARTDMRILDEYAGPENWQDEFCEIKGNLYCTIKIRNPETGEWVGKCDCGIESHKDGEGNQKKGEASDAFKRAGFKWGIGRELYTAPFIFLKVETKESTKGGKSCFELKNRFERFFVKNIDYNEDGSIKRVVIVNDKGKQVFQGFGEAAEPTASEKPSVPTVTKTVPVPLIEVSQVAALADELARTGKDAAFLINQVNSRFKVSHKQIEQITVEQYKWVMMRLAKTPDAPQSTA